LSFDNSRRNSGVVIDKERSETSIPIPPPLPTPPVKPAGYNTQNTLTNNASTKTTSEEVERRRAELAAMARAAEARLKEVEQQCEQAESKLEQELRERLLAEQRLRELEENRLRQQQAIVIEAPQARTSTWAQGATGPTTGTWTIDPELKVKVGAETRGKEAETRGKEVETRAKEAEAEIQTLMVALMEAEQKRAKAEAAAQAATDKARELESESKAVRAALAEANRKATEAEAAMRAAQESARAVESLIVEAEAAGRQATERYQHVEAELQYEAKQRALAEQKLKEFEDELSSYLELDWSKGEPDLSRAVAVRPGGGADEVVSQFHAQIEAERKVRREAEEARASLEHKTRELERALRIAEENNRQIAALNLSSSVDDEQAYTLKKRKGFKYELKFISYGMGIALLLVLLIAIVATLFLRA
jgi:hypothetical protein